jgi:hypothetical protein
MLSWLPLVTSTSAGSRRRPEPPSGGGLSASSGAQKSNATAPSNAAEKSSTTAATNAPQAPVTATSASQSPAVPAPLGNRFQPATATAQAPTVSAHVSAAQRRARDPLATSMHEA